MPGWQQEGGSAGGVRARTFVRHPHSRFLRPFAPLSLSLLFLLLSFLLLLLRLHSCRGGTILWRFVANRYFVSEERSRINLSGVLHAPQASLTALFAISNQSSRVAVAPFFLRLPCCQIPMKNRLGTLSRNISSYRAARAIGNY